MLGEGMGKGRALAARRARSSHSNGWDVYGLVIDMSASKLFVFFGGAYMQSKVTSS